MERKKRAHRASRAAARPTFGAGIAPYTLLFISERRKAENREGLCAAEPLSGNDYDDDGVAGLCEEKPLSRDLSSRGIGDGENNSSFRS